MCFSVIIFGSSSADIARKKTYKLLQNFHTSKFYSFTEIKEYFFHFITSLLITHHLVNDHGAIKVDVDILKTVFIQKLYYTHVLAIKVKCQEWKTSHVSCRHHLLLE